MRKFGLLSTSAIASSALFGASIFATPALAQPDAETPVPTSAVDCEAIESLPDRENCLAQVAQSTAQTPDVPQGTLLVTGTRIRQPNIASTVPITSVSADELFSAGDVSVGDALNDLPSLRSTFSQANSNRFIGTTGINILDLRGLGTSRTLVLVNSRRHVTSSIGAFLVDVNTIPSDLINRVDVITGGNSAVYGSDAVAGVVNFVLRRDFDGIRLRGQAGISGAHDRGIQFVSLTAGRNFFDDRANVAINLEYVNAEALYFEQRPRLTGAFAGRCQFNLAEFTAGEPAAGDGVPDQQFFCGVRNAAISDGGTILANASAASCQSAAFGPLGASAAIGAARCLNPGTPFGQPRMFRWSPTGELLQDIPTLDFRPFGSGNIVSDPNSLVPGSTLRNTGQIAPGLDRYTANLLASFNLAEAFRPFVEAKFVRVFARQEGQPSFFQATFPGFFGAGRGIRCDNPFLTAQNIAALQAIGRCLTPATFAAETIPVARFNVDFGGRSELVERETIRGVAGVEGDFNDDWHYEVSFNHGRFDVVQSELNDLHIFQTTFLGAEGPFLQAVDAIRDPVTGQIVCRDPAARAAGCVPINLFGVGRPSPAALDFVNRTSFVEGHARQTNVVAFVNGDLSQLFELPGGPVRFVIGGEYRRETAFRQADPISAAGATFFNAFPVFDPPAFEVMEAFGEIQLPLLRDLPFAEELTVSAAARFSDYNTAADRTFSYNVNGTWAPTRDIRFRGNYSQAVRVPTLIDLFNPRTQNFAFVADPCDFRRINIGPFREANCRALGVPVGFEAVLTNSQTAEIISSGNPFLEEETGKSLTLGAVLTPRWVPGLSLTVDYYRIRVENLIAVLGAQTILNLCVDLPDINNQFCQLVFPRRTTDDPGTPHNEIGALASPALISGGVNFARQEADGIDMEIAYRRTFGNGHRLNVRGIATYVLKRNNFISPTDPAFSDRQLSELGDPRWSANLNVTYGMGPFDLRYSLNYIGRTTIGAFEQYFPHQGRPPTNADNTREIFWPDALYHAARLSTRVNNQFTFYLGVDNIFDTQPPLGLLGGGDGDPYDPIGRYVYAGATVDF
ncbi:MAG: TonB-dependent receptor domain-containing protein [Sphingosinicella sp.]